ncbi:DMT family transporter [Kineosporia succinea]|uniref:Drug/metabolite transporter (DMT)-like permease n=1 Tax=Kineosporia succinea TaxID=84632 RepID=A0ABT9P1Z6_9ACTN|nr:DMT family transporter [Kineosporia succinea]MDP9826701.1 drug/metabolite transporter (DMT)-like permease [Kineosporia succinea]
MNAPAILVAFLDAIAFGASTALMHHSASRAPEGPGGLRGLVLLLRHLATQPKWLAGIAASLGGLGLHSVALALGSLAVVQPIVVTGLVFAFVFRAVLDRRWPQPRVMIWVSVVAAGIAVFLVGAHSSESSADFSTRSALVFVAIAGVAAAATWWLATKVPTARAGLLMGVAGGLIFGMIASMIKVVTSSGSVWEALTTWPIYALAGLGAAGFLSNQYAYNRAPLSHSLPVLNVVNPVIAVTFGVLVFSEAPSSNPALLTLELVGLVTVLTGVAFLAREETGEKTEEPMTAART